MSASSLRPLGTAAAVGLACLAAQGLLTLLFTRCSGFWTKQPAFVAHQLVALPLMLYVAGLGCVEWLSPREADDGTADDRILGYDSTGAHLATVLTGALVLWDIPLTFVSTIWSVDAMAHHVGLAVLGVLVLSQQLVLYYVPFFVGVTELSSVPLQVVDFFHPKHFESVLEGRPRLAALVFAFRGLFALSFLAVRTVWFPIVVGTQVAPDLVAVAARGGPTAAFAATLGGFALAFTVLQWFWSYKILLQVAKLFSGGEGSKAPKSELVSKNA